MAVSLIIAILIDWHFNPLERSRDYRLARTKNWFLTGMLYSCYYMGRYNMSIINNAEVRDMLETSKTTFGSILLAGHFSYAVFMLSDGHKVDRWGGKTAICVGAIGSAFVNLVSAFLFYSDYHTVPSLMVCNIMNNFFQPFGSLSVIKINSSWYKVSERGVFSGVMGVMIGCGYFLALVTGGLILDNFPFWVVFAKPGILLGIFACLVWTKVSDKPDSKLVDMEDERLSSEKDFGVEGAEVVEQPSTDSKEGEGGKSKKESLAGTFIGDVKKVFANRSLRVLCLAMTCVGWIREGFFSWFTSFLEEVYDIPVGTSLYTFAATGVTIGGMFGSLSGGYISDRFFDSKRAPVVGGFFLLQGLVFVVLVWGIGPDNPYGAVACTTLIASLLFGTLTLILGCASADAAGAKGSGTSSGTLSFFAYTSSGISSFVNGYLIQNYGWDLWAICLLPASFCGCLCCLYLNHVQNAERKAKKQRDIQVRRDDAL